MTNSPLFKFHHCVQRYFRRFKKRVFSIFHGDHLVMHARFEIIQLMFVVCIDSILVNLYFNPSPPPFVIQHMFHRRHLASSANRRSFSPFQTAYYCERFLTTKIVIINWSSFNVIFYTPTLSSSRFYI